MSRLSDSQLVWGCFLVAFLLLEIPAALHITPWDTLSRTSWLEEQRFVWLKTILFGFLIGLAVHIRFATGLWKTTLGGVVIALILNYLWTASG